jgi:hypothetical protein
LPTTAITVEIRIVKCNINVLGLDQIKDDFVSLRGSILSGLSKQKNKVASTVQLISSCKFLRIGVS